MKELREIKEEISEVKRLILELRRDKLELIGSETIALMLNTTPNSLRVRLPKLQEQGYPIKKDGGKIVSMRSELGEFIRKRFNEL